MTWDVSQVHSYNSASRIKTSSISTLLLILFQQLTPDTRPSIDTPPPRCQCTSSPPTLHDTITTITTDLSPRLKEPWRKYKKFPPLNLPNRQWPNKTLDAPCRFLDTSLRDGNQSLPNPMVRPSLLRATLHPKAMPYTLNPERGLTQ